MAGEPDFGDGLEPVEDAADNGLGKDNLPAIVGDSALVPAFFAGRALPSFRTASAKTGRLTERRMHRTDALRMIWRRARAAGIATELGCHSFRATGITVYLQNGGLLEHAQQMAAHESARTTKLYDRRNDKVTLDEVEKITL